MSKAPVVVILLVAACSGGGGGGERVPDPLALAPSSLGGGVVNAAYSATLFASGGAGGYQWSLTAGSLPPGLGGIPGSGASVGLSGFPSAEGSYSFTVELRDAQAATVTRSYTIVISAPGPGGGPTSVTGAPSARGQHTAVWTGTEMIVWGGVDFALGPLSTGGAYDPATDSWRALPILGAPVPRFGHTAVWTGTEMILWGGFDSAGPINSGGAYDPATNSWRTLTTTGAPIPRGWHTAVWTGSRMIVWGGQGVFPPPAPNSVDRVFSDGAAYDPVADAWTPIAAGGPAARGHTAVWTGSRMIVWGGRDAFALTISTQNIGGVYDPAAAAWVPMNTTAAPAARVNHTAVWTGSEMIVWGGRADPINDHATGGRYVPGSDAWTATATGPSARWGHTAALVNGEVIIWGGFSGPNVLGTGSIYTPATNSWRALPAGFAPSARGEHSAVSAGVRMIVWGGRGVGLTYVNTGAILGSG